ncbi:MAG TPA: xanthine dehydrogenase family protein molybdopterin-binding subunit [Blastocatellia bacterium]|nr:xanthine dehydrogenase family protein molybdopterin-binding subunit [Blastocatellia bacterium]
MKDTMVGKPMPRVDGALKVTGRAAYAAEHDPPNLAHAVIVTSEVAKGRVEKLDAPAAQRAAGVLAVITHLNAPRLQYREQKSALDPSGERLHVLQDNVVRFSGQPIAVVVAETLDQAEYASSLVRIEYAPETPRLDFSGGLKRAVAPDVSLLPNSPQPADTRRGDPERAFAESAVKVEAEYLIPRQQHNPMEPHATIARWEGDRLTLWDKTQWVVNVRNELAAVFGLAPEQVHVISPFVGGAFGATLRAWPHVTLAAMAARFVGRPVKLVLARRQMYTGTGYRPETWQRVTLGASRDGRLKAIIHHGVAETSSYEQYVERLLEPTGFLHSCPNVRTRYRILPLDTHTPVFMRAPGVASGIFAIECALDELAHELRMDPVALRLLNEPENDEHTDRPFSSRSTRECYRLAAERFGWAARKPEPRSMSDGKWLIGWGMATAVYHTLRGPAGARVRLLADGRVIVESAASDMGPGTYTSMTQVASDALGIPPERVRFALGDSTFPYAPSHGGSQTMASVGSATHAACLALRAKALEMAAADEQSPLRGATPDQIDAAEGRLFLRDDPSRGERYQEILARHGLGVLERTEMTQPGDERNRYSMQAFGALFAEVAVDRDLGLVRVRRLVGAYGVGHVVNPKMARSQAIGGMVGGIGMALMEHTVMDRQSGRIVNADLANYLVPVNADIADLDAIFIKEDDPYVNPLGVKGVGELALVGVAPAIANAVFHATGKRVRDLPVMPEKLL